MNQEVKIGIEEHVLWNLCWINQTIANKPQLTRFPYFSCKNKRFSSSIVTKYSYLL